MTGKIQTPNWDALRAMWEAEGRNAEIYLFVLAVDALLADLAPYVVKDVGKIDEQSDFRELLGTLKDVVETVRRDGKILNGRSGNDFLADGSGLVDRAAELVARVERKLGRQAISPEVLVGLGRNVCEPGKYLRICVQHQFPNQSLDVVRLDLPRDVADSFLITDVKIGHNSQLRSTGALDACSFDRELERQVRLGGLDPWSQDLFLAVEVTNKSTEPRWFSGNVVCLTPRVVERSVLPEQPAEGGSPSGG